MAHIGAHFFGYIYVCVCVLSRTGIGESQSVCDFSFCIGELSNGCTVVRSIPSCQPVRLSVALNSIHSGDSVVVSNCACILNFFFFCFCIEEYFASCEIHPVKVYTSALCLV